MIEAAPPARDLDPQRAREADARDRLLGSGLLVALVLALLEGLSDRLLPRSPFVLDLGSRLLLLAPLPLLGLGVGFVIGRAYWLAAAGVALLAARVGDLLVLGPKARELPLAEHWDLIAGGLTLLVFFGLRTVALRGRGRALALAGLLSLHAAVVFVQRGHYREIREGALIALAVLAVAVLGPLAPPLRGWRRRATLLVAAGLAALGALGIVRDGAVSEWAHHRTSLATTWARPLWRTLGDAVPAPDPDPTLRRRPYFGTTLAQASQARLFSDARPSGVLLVTIDALRHDLLDRRIRGAPVTPYLDALVEGGFAFDRAYAPANLTNATFVSIFSGAYPSEILARPTGTRDLPLVTHRLRDAGVRCRGLFFWVVAAGGVYAEARRGGLGFDPEYAISMRDPSPEEIVAKLAPDEAGPWFSFVHLMRPHWPYDSADERFRAGDSEFERYAAEVRQADDDLRRVVEGLRARPDVGPFWVIVASDHGEEFGEHGLRFHGLQLFEETIHVPLVVQGPGVPVGRSAVPVSLLDLAPTLADLFGAGDATAAPTSGRSLLPLIAGLDDPDRAAAVAAEMPDLRRRIRAQALVRRDRKTVLQRARGTVQHYDLAADPGELRDLAAERRPQIVEDLAALAAITRDAETPPPRPFDLDLADRIESRPRAALATLASTPDAERAATLLLVTPHLTPNEARDLLAATPAPDARCRPLLRLAAGERDEALRRAVLARQETADDPFELVAIFALLARDRGARDDTKAVHRPLDARARLAVDLARETYRAGFGGRAMNFRLVEEAARASSPYLRRLGADYLAALPPEELPASVRGSVLRAWEAATTARHRAALLGPMARLGGEEFATVRDRVWAAGSREERARLASLLLDGAEPDERSRLRRAERPRRASLEGSRVPPGARRLWIAGRPPSDRPAPWRLQLRVGERVLDLDLADAAPGAALGVALEASDEGAVIAWPGESSEPDAAFPVVRGLLLR